MVSNNILNAIIVASVVLQVLTISLPVLRTALGLVPLDGFALSIVAGSLLVTILGAEIWSRRSNPIASAT